MDAVIRQLYQSIHLFNLVAFLAVLVAIVILALAGKATDLAIMTGLVGVLGSFKPWGSTPPTDHTTPAGTATDPIQTEVVNSPVEPVPTVTKKEK